MPKLGVDGAGLAAGRVERWRELLAFFTADCCMVARTLIRPWIEPISPEALAVVLRLRGGLNVIINDRDGVEALISEALSDLHDVQPETEQVVLGHGIYSHEAERADDFLISATINSLVGLEYRLEERLRPPGPIISWLSVLDQDLRGEAESSIGEECLNLRFVVAQLAAFRAALPLWTRFDAATVAERQSFVSWLRAWQDEFAVPDSVLDWAMSEDSRILRALLSRKV